MPNHLVHLKTPLLTTDHKLTITSDYSGFCTTLFLLSLSCPTLSLSHQSGMAELVGLVQRLEVAVGRLESMSSSGGGGGPAAASGGIKKNAN